VIVLILGSGPAVVASAEWPRAYFDRLVAINNAWRVRSDWDDTIFPDDFPQDRWPSPTSPHQRLVTSDTYVDAQNAYGGFLLAGATMAFTATYWALHTLKPSVIAYFGCDMVYSGTSTHFYGRGTADPLRDDPSLRSIEAKATRAMVMASQQGCALVNLSNGPSRLTFPKVALSDLDHQKPQAFNAARISEVIAQEAEGDFATPTGFYEKPVTPSLLTQLDEINAAWRGLETDDATALAS